MTYAPPQSSRILSYVRVFWRILPTSHEKPTETIEENMPPMPTTEATARFGKMSETTVNMVADQPWLAAPASAKKLVASQTFRVCVANTTGTAQIAQSRAAVFRARFSDQPLRRSHADNPPPAMLDRKRV